MSVLAARRVGRFSGFGDTAKCACGCASCGPGAAPPGLGGAPADCSCGCASCGGELAPNPSTQGGGGGFGGIFSTFLNVAGSLVGDPALGSQVAAQALPGYAPITETPQQIADRVAPGVKTALAAGTPVSLTGVTSQAQQIGQSVAPDVAADLAAQGYTFAPGTVGAELQKPSVLDAFGAANRGWVALGAAALGVALLWKSGV